ncbi:MAG: hypothetical protein MJA32_05690 [Proteobacteria bacterium]|nr:hypothetical protein [Pseudomonadota bacterium]
MRTLIIFALAALTASACAARPSLEPRPGGNPAGVDLSGLWVLRGAVHGAVSDEQTIVIPRRSRSGGFDSHGERPTGRTKRNKGPSAHVFLESGRTLKITQTAYGLFVSFDRAVVEEVGFGENRTVAVGPIEAQRVSGWEGPTLVVETMDDGGNVLRESWSLDGGDVLVRDVVIVSGDEETLSVRQVFDRS